MRTITKKAFLILLVCSFIASLSFTATAKPYNCPWCGEGGGYQTYMQVTDYIYIGQANCIRGQLHQDSVWKLYRTFHEYCSNCDRYEKAYYDVYVYYCPGTGQPEIDPPPPFEILR